MQKNGSRLAAVIRLVLTSAALLLQIAFFALTANLVVSYSPLVFFAAQAFGFVVSVYILSNTDDHTYASAWIILVLLLPVFGAFMYFSWGRINTNRKQAAANRQAADRYASYFTQSEDRLLAFSQTYPEYTRIARYLALCGFPLTYAGDCEYYPLGEDYFRALQAELEKAERFIFMEYFIIAEGKIWQQIRRTLKEKAAAGVEVRILYDDGGSLFTIHTGFRKELERDGIQVQVFNPVHRAVRHFHLNYRNHRKITVIDGRIGYTGGINIGDEYANLYVKHGHWKDTAIGVTGSAVRTMTLLFLQMWDCCAGTVTDHADRYLCDEYPSHNKNGYVQFFSDHPANNPKNTGETTYMQLLYSAKQYVYITTPYLIIDNPMIYALCSAAQSGADVRILTPHIPDKWFVHATTRSFYGRLIRQGVRIFEYTPGFIHSKMIVSDDRIAIVGSINMDFRSFFLHDECALMVCGSPAVREILADICRTMELCKEITPEQMKNRSVFIKIIQSLLKLFSPMM